MDFGPHAAFIWISYGAVTVTIAGLIAWLILDGRKQAADLAALEKRGIRRRSSAGAE
ncbi:MAG TPA: heme exporter protein CcmD [Hyphomicrobium sp.]|jgi:heme exporter protein D|nr:heme exporter protein CcmD [Hyphomicrobium sp.]